MSTRDTTWPAGTPCWTDYSAEDLSAAQEFYSATFGWTFTEGKPEFAGYSNAVLKDRLVAGMMPKMAADQPAAWVTYFAVADAAVTASAINDNGGTVFAGPHDVGDLGVMLVAFDPQGLVFGAWQAKAHVGATIVNEPGALIWNEAASPDHEAGREFYAAVFGWVFEEIPGQQGYATFSIGEGPLGGFGPSYNGDMFGWQACYAVTDTDAIVAVIEASGGKLLVGPMDSPYGRFAVVADPWGATFELMGTVAS